MSVHRATVLLIAAIFLYVFMHYPQRSAQTLAYLLSWQNAEPIPPGRAVSYLPAPAGSDGSAATGQQRCREAMTEMATPRYSPHNGPNTSLMTVYLASQVLTLTNSLEAVYCLARYEADYAKLDAASYAAIMNAGSLLAKLAGRPLQEDNAARVGYAEPHLRGQILRSPGDFGPGPSAVLAPTGPAYPSEADRIIHRFATTPASPTR